MEVPVKIRVDGASEAQRAFQKLSDSWNVGKIAIAGLTGALAGMAVINKVTEWFKESRKESQEYFQLQQQLKVSIGYTSIALRGQAEQLGKSLVVHDETITRVQLLLSNYVKSESQIKKLTPAVINLASALGIDFNHAAMIVAKSISGTNDSIGRYKIHITGAADSTERIDSIITALNKKFAGQAEAVAETKDVWDKFTLSMSEAGKAMYSATFHYGKLKKEAEEEAIVGKIGYYTKILHEEEKYNKKVIDNARARLKELYATPEGKQLRKASYDKTMQTSLDASSKSMVLIDKLQREIWAKTDAGKIKVLKKEMQDELWNTELTENQKLLIRQKYAIEIRGIEEKIAKDKENRREREIKLMVEAHKNTEELLQKNRKENQKASEDKQKLIERQVELQKKIAGWSKKYDEDQIERLGDEKQKRLDLTASQLGQLTRLFEGHKSFIGLYKTLAIAQATMDTWAAANKALASMAPPFSYIEAGISVALGIANVAKISSQKFATGGVVTGGIPGRDSVPAMLMPGEIVYNPANPNPALASMITNSTTNSGNTHFHMGDIVINGGADRSTIDAIGQVTEKALINAMRKAQNLGKISASGLTIRS